MKIKCPCYKCVSYAICVNSEYVICDVLYDHITNHGINGRLSTLVLMKCLAIRVYHMTDKVEFIRDRQAIWEHLKARMKDHEPKYLRLIVLLGFCYYRVVIRCLSVVIPVVEKFEYVRDLLKGRHIWD